MTIETANFLAGLKVAAQRAEATAKRQKTAEEHVGAMEVKEDIEKLIAEIEAEG